MALRVIFYVRAYYIEIIYVYLSNILNYFVSFFSMFPTFLMCPYFLTRRFPVSFSNSVWFVNRFSRCISANGIMGGFKRTRHMKAFRPNDFYTHPERSRANNGETDCHV